MNTQDPPHTENPSASHWQILGEFELQAEAFADGALQVRLKEALNQLGLHNNFLNRMLNSLQQTGARLLRSDAEINLEHIHLLVYVPSNRSTLKQTWGFYSVEKLEDAKEGGTVNEHTIEIYLYLEGDPIPVHGNK